MYHAERGGTCNSFARKFVGNKLGPRFDEHKHRVGLVSAEEKSIRHQAIVSLCLTK